MNAVIANSHAGARFAEKLYGYDPAHMHVVWNGMRIEEFEQKGLSTHDYRSEFFGPGGFMEQRGAPKRVRAAKKAYDTDSARRLWEVSEQLTGVTYDFGS